MIKRLFYDEAFRQAIKSDMNFTHGALVIFRGKIIGRGYNSYIESNYKRSIHAEERAILNALKNGMPENEFKKCEMVVIRFNGHGECLNSKPCCNCTNLINKYCIKKVYHS